MNSHPNDQASSIESPYTIERRPAEVDGYQDDWFVGPGVEIQLNRWMKPAPDYNLDRSYAVFGDETLSQVAAAAFAAAQGQTKS